MTAGGKRSPLGLAVLGILTDGPTHAYRVQKLIKDWGKDRVVNVRQRASVYQAIDRLLRLGLIDVQGTDRTRRRPERTVYAITDTGLAAGRAWTKEMLATVGGEFPEFPVGLAFLTMLTPQEAQAQLETRLAALDAELAELEPMINGSSAVPRIFLVEEEYRHAVLSAERVWVGRLVAQLRDGTLTWSQEWLRRMAAELTEDHREEHP